MFEWYGRGMVKSFVGLGMVLIAPLFTLALFLVLYNNSYLGHLILLSLILPNIAILLCPVRLVLGKDAASHITLGSVCAATSLIVLLALELLFPMMWPADYSHIRDLSKSLVQGSPGSPSGFKVVFTNGPEPRMEPVALTVGNQSRPVIRMNDPGREWEYYGYDRNGDFKYVNIIRWNSHGYFDRDYSYARPSGVYRIVVIGDSYVESYQVPLHRTFHKLLEGRLNEPGFQMPAHVNRVEVIALGHSGTGQRHHFRILSRKAIHYHPDMVVVTFCGNDFCDDSQELNRERRLSTGAVSPHCRDLVRHGLYAMAFAVRRYNELQMNRVKLSPEVLQWSAEDIPRIEAAWQKTLDTVRQSRDFCVSRGIRFQLA